MGVSRGVCGTERGRPRHPCGVGMVRIGPTILLSRGAIATWQFDPGSEVGSGSAVFRASRQQAGAAHRRCREVLERFPVTVSLLTLASYVAGKTLPTDD